MSTQPSPDGSEFDVIAGIPIVDCDSHVTEPPDLWSSRVPSKWKGQAPRVAWDDRNQSHRWTVGNRKLSSVAGFASAGWKDFPPSHPPTLEEADPGSFDPNARLLRLDEYGVDTQLLYPNILAFYSHAFMALEPELSLACVRAYNDFITEFADADSRRLIPRHSSRSGMSKLRWRNCDGPPTWATRALCSGWTSRSWDSPVLPTDTGIPSSPSPRRPHYRSTFTSASRQVSEEELHGAIRVSDRGDFARDSALMMLGNAAAISLILTSDLCERFPTLNFVSVESGCGWIPFMIEALDWQWMNSGAAREHPHHELPSTYFRRQVYGSFWFEQESFRRTIELIPDNLMFETDYPHPTALCPGPASYAELPTITAARGCRGYRVTSLVEYSTTTRHASTGWKRRPDDDSRDGRLWLAGLKPMS